MATTVPSNQQNDECRIEEKIPFLYITTADTPKLHRIKAWQEKLGLVFHTKLQNASYNENYSATLISYNFGDFVLCHGRIDSGRYSRTGGAIQFDDLDHYVVHFLLRGSIRFARAGTHADLRPLDIAILDLSCPADFQIRDMEAISLILPRTALALSLRHPDHQHGRVLPRETPVAALLGRHMAALVTAAPGLWMPEAAALAAPVRDLVTTCLNLSAGFGQEPSLPQKRNPAGQVRIYIERHLERETLTPAAIMTDLGISRSQLYRQFERFGGVHHYIRRRRLRRALLLVGNPRHADKRIGDIAYSVGFTDEAHFSRLFRQAFGLSPRAVRAAGLRAGSAASSAIAAGSLDTTAFAHWLRDLAAG